MGNGEIIKEPWSAAGVLKSAEGRGHFDSSACRAGAAPAAAPSFICCQPRLFKCHSEPLSFRI